MLTQGEDVEAHALEKRGWSYAAIARHIDCDWRTVKAYLEGRQPGTRRRTEPAPLEPFVAYLAARFADDAHVWASALFDEVVELGYARSYPSFVRQVRSAVWPASHMGPLHRWFCQRHGTTPVASHGTT